MALEEVFDARRAAEDIDGDGFAFLDMDGNEHVLPSVAGMKMKEVKRLNSALSSGDDEAALERIRELAGDGVADAIDDMPIGVSGRLVLAWIQSTGGDDEGKESPKPTRRPPTKRSGSRSKKT